MAGAWYGKGMPEMWSSAQAADTRMAWDQVLAWRRTHDLLDFHQGQLRRAREELLRAWPAERSPAAAAFARRIDGTIQVLDAAKVAAARNQDALAAVLSSLRDTRNDMAVLVQEWQEHRRTPVAAGRSAVVPPEYAVTVRAQERMARNDQEVLAAYRTMVELPASRDPRGNFGDEPSKPGSRVPVGGGGSGGGVDALVPPVVRSPAEIDAAAGVVGGPGAGLAGLVGPGVPGVAAGPAGSDSSVPGGFVPGSGVPPTPSGPGVGSGFGGPTSAVPAGRVPSGRVAGSPFGGRSGAGWVNPVGGVIGAPPEVGPAGGQPHGPAAPAAGGRSTSTGMGSGMPVGGAGGGRRGEERPVEPRRTLHWEVAEGVPPVIEAPQERPFELGPGVFGVDRA